MYRKCQSWKSQEVILIKNLMIETFHLLSYVFVCSTVSCSISICIDHIVCIVYTIYEISTWNQSKIRLLIAHWSNKYIACSYTFFCLNLIFTTTFLFSEAFSMLFLFSWWKYKHSFNLEIFMTFVYGLQETYIHRNWNWIFSLTFYWNIFCVYTEIKRLTLIEIRMSQSFGTERPNLNCIHTIHWNAIDVITQQIQNNNFRHIDPCYWDMFWISRSKTNDKTENWLQSLRKWSYYLIPRKDIDFYSFFFFWNNEKYKL